MLPLSTSFCIGCLSYLSAIIASISTISFLEKELLIYFLIFLNQDWPFEKPPQCKNEVQEIQLFQLQRHSCQHFLENKNFNLLSDTSQPGRPLRVFKDTSMDNDFSSLDTQIISTFWQEPIPPKNQNFPGSFLQCRLTPMPILKVLPGTTI